MNLCRANVDFPPWSGIIRAMEATSADASGIIDAENAVQHNNVSKDNTHNSKNKTSFFGIIFQTVNVTSFSANMMNLCRVNVDFPPWSGIIRAVEATSADASVSSTRKKPWQ
ncbi:hypothetical protein CEXT_51871 [Caerostris extrusa]|uniref:Uncharacterized protein n=1 Tax=Caerostris extrusa TaxID=172846 RepID=A0AAV4PP49_CAEEX|nr:hypothetical protein CEXT_51871 [Caerostris extrusa]